MTIAIDWEVKQQFKQTNKQNQYAEAIITHVSYIDSHKLAKSGYFVSSSISRECLTHIGLASLIWDICKQYSPRCDAAERGVPSGAILFA